LAYESALSQAGASDSGRSTPESSNDLTDQRHDAPAPESGEPADVADVRRRQAAGEIAADLDPPLFLLALMAAIAAPVILPQVARRMGVDTTSPDFEARYAEHMKRIMGHLAG